MVSTFTSNKILEKPASGDYVDAWAAPINTDWDLVDTAFGGSTAINAVAASGTVVLTATQYRPPNIIISGLLTADVNYQVPSGKGGFWSVYNNTTGAFAITISSGGAGTSVIIPQGKRAQICCDGTNVALSDNAPTNPGGSTTQVQYNKAGLLAGSALFTFDDGTGLLALTGTARLVGSSSGYLAQKAAAAGANLTYTWPAAEGTAGQFLTTDGSGTLSWSGASAGVSTFSAGSTGFTPSTPTSGAVVLSGTLGTGSGGTNLTTFGAANRALYSTSASILVAGTLPVAAGGSGATTLTGVLIGTGTTAFTVKTNPAGAFVGDTDVQTLTNKTLTAPVLTSINAASTVSDTGTIATTSVGFRGIPQNAKTGSYTLVITDNGKHISNTTGGFTIPANASVAFPIGATVVLFNNSGSSQAIAITSDTLRQAGTANTGSRTLAQFGLATVVKIASTTWAISGAGLS